MVRMAGRNWKQVKAIGVVLGPVKIGYFLKFKIDRMGYT